MLFIFTIACNDDLESGVAGLGVGLGGILLSEGGDVKDLLFRRLVLGVEGENGGSLCTVSPSGAAAAEGVGADVNDLLRLFCCFREVGRWRRCRSLDFLGVIGSALFLEVLGLITSIIASQLLLRG